MFAFDLKFHLGECGHDFGSFYVGVSGHEMRLSDGGSACFSFWLLIVGHVSHHTCTDTVRLSQVLTHEFVRAAGTFVTSPCGALVWQVAVREAVAEPYFRDSPADGRQRYGKDSADDSGEHGSGG